MTTGVQNLEPAAYLPPSPPASAPDAKGAADSSGKPGDFQSELDRQDTGAQETKAAGRPEKGSGKPDKKRDTSAEDSNQSPVLSVPTPEPQRQILPLALAWGNPDEHAKPDEHSERPAQKCEPRPSDAALILPADPGQPGEPKPALTGPLPPTLDPSKNKTLPPGVWGDATKPEDQSAKAAKPGGPSESQPVSRSDLKLAHAIPPEPVTAAIQETVDSAPSSPSALAFAARIAAAPQNAGETGTENPSQPPAAPGSQTSSRIPLRYAATAQILPNAERELKADGATIDRASHTDFRTDMVLPRIETARQAAPTPTPAAPQQSVPTARLERIIEPPATPPASAHDIRVRVPDNNGGSTQVRFVESGGEVRVSVRTADEALAQNLRGHLNDLTQRLADGGIPAEFWKPGSSASSQNNQHQPDRDGRGPGGQQSGGQSGQQDHHEKRPEWLEEMEASLHGAQE